MSRTAQTTQTQPRPTTPWSSDLVGVGAAVVCAMIAWFITARQAELELTVRLGGEAQHVTGPAVAVTAAASALVGFVALRVLERVTRRALEIWTAVAVVVTLLSLFGPLSATSATATGTLIALHAVVAAVTIGSAQSSRRRHRPC